MSTQGNGPCRVLVVDDERDAADTMALLLKLHGHEVRTAYNGHEALQVAQSFSPHVTLLDLVMPQSDGLSVGRTFRQDHPSCHLIMVTGRAHYGNRTC